MRKTIAATIVAASLAGGSLVGAAFGGPSLAGAAAETATGAAGWVEETLSGLVSGGTITQDQADAVQTALEEARPERPRRHHHHGLRIGLGIVAEALDMTTEDLRAALQTDKTIAELAGEKGVDVDTVVDALVAAHKARIDAKVAAGDLTQEEADEKLANAEERATAFVNGELRLRGHHGPPPAEVPPADGDAQPQAGAA